MGLTIGVSFAGVAPDLGLYSDLWLWISGQACRGGGCPPDATIADGSVVVTDCMGRWFDGSLAFGAAQPLAKQSANNATERDPWVSSSGLTLYYARDQNGAPDGGIYRASRALITDVFGDDVQLTMLDTTHTEDRPSLTQDERTLVTAISPGGSQANIMLATARRQPSIFPRRMISTCTTSTQR